MGTEEKIRKTLKFCYLLYCFAIGCGWVAQGTSTVFNGLRLKEKLLTYIGK